MKIENCKLKIIRIIQWCFATLPRKIVSCLVIAGILILSIWHLIFKPAPVEASWWDEDWMYRRAVPISTHTSEESDVYIEITNIDTSDTTKFQADCGDIRFTKLDGTLLDYYIVSGCGTATTTIHVYYDTFPAGAQTIYFYYGNPSIDNGYETTDFTTEATNYSIGSIGSEETGTGPVLWLKFDEGYGNTAYDSSSQGNNGTITNATWTESAKFGKALSFDGTGDYVNLGTPFITAAPFTVCAWIKAGQLATDKGDEMTIFSIAKTGGNFDEADWFNFRIDDGAGTENRVQATLRNNSSTAGVVTTAAITANTWHHVCYVEAATNNRSVYLDAAYKGTNATSITPDPAELQEIHIGNLAWTDIDHFDGTIDEVKVYPYARSEIQIKRDYNQGAAARFGRDESWLTEGLVGHWKMDEDSWSGAANEVIDSSGAGNHGTAADNATTTGFAKYGRAGTFDGSGDYVSIDSSGSEFPFNANGIFINGTLSFWLKTNEISDDNRSPLSFGNSVGDTQSALFFHKDGATLKISSRCVNAFWDSVTISADTWYHIVVTSNDPGYTWYVNNNLEGAQNYGSNTDGRHNFLYFGTGYSDYWNGNVDDVRIYNRALSEREVARLYEYGPPPIAHWTFDEGSGSSAYDSSENENTGTLQGDTTWVSSADCKFGNCLSFDGSGDYVELLSPVDFEATDTYTFSAWIKTPDLSDNRDIFRSVGDADLKWYVHGQGKQYFYIGAQGYTSDTTVDNNTWRHVAVVFNGTNITFYLDGSPDGTLGASGADHNITYSRISYSGPFESFNGMIDDVRIYNYALSEKQIAELYAQGSVGHSGATVGHWKLDEGYGTSAKDSSGRNNDLTLSSESWTTAGKFSRAFNGDGAKWLTRGGDDDDFDFTATQDFSVTMWFKSDSSNNPSGNEFLLSKYSTAGYGIYANTDGNIVFGIDDDDTWTPDDRAGPGVNKDFYDNTWHHVSVIKVSTLSIETFIDGKSMGKDSSISATGTLENSATLYIGDKDGADNGDEFVGDIDEVKIYRFALSQEDILLDYNKGKSALMGAVGTESDGTTPSWSQDRAYCPPGFTGTCDPPVGEWKFDEGGGSTAYDTSANSFDGTLEGNTTWKGSADCKHGGCLSFDGDGDQVNVGDVTDLNSAPDFTISFWMNQNVLDVTGTLFVKYSAGDDIWIQTFFNGRFYFELGTVDDAGAWFDYSTVMSAKTWHHVVWAYDGSGAGDADKMKVYIDGTEQSLTFWGTIGTTTADLSGIDARIGDDFDGEIDEVKIFDYAMTQEQIAWLYNKGKPVAYWKFDEGEGDTAHDSSGNGNNGDLTDVSWVSSGKYNSALNFAGDDYVDCGTGTSLNITEDITLSAWIKTTSSASGQQKIISKGDTGIAYGYELFYQANIDTLRFGDENGWAQVAGESINDDNWHHVVGTYDGAGSIAGYKIYIDGQEKNVTESGSANGFALTSEPLIIGGHSDDGVLEHFWSGAIDEVKIYNYALTEQQIKIDYNQGAAVRFGD